MSLRKRLDRFRQRLGISYRLWRRLTLLIGQHPIVLLIGAIAGLLVGASTLVLLFEARSNESISSFGEAIWYGIVTITTVGYGDEVPRTPGGRAVGAVLMFSGVVLFSLLTGTISSLLVARRILEGQGLEEIQLTDHLLLCGWNVDAPLILAALNRGVDGENLRSGRVGRAARQRLGVVLINDLAPGDIEGELRGYPNLELHYVRGNYTLESVLNRAGAERARAALLVPDTSGLPPGTAPSDDRALLGTLTLKGMMPTLKVYVHLLSRDNLAHLRRAGADDLVVPNEYTASLLAGHVLAPGVPQTFNELLNTDGINDLSHVPIPPEFIGRTMLDLLTYFKATQDWLLVGFVQPAPVIGIAQVLSGDYSAIDEFIQRKFQEAGISTGVSRDLRLNLNPAIDYVIQDIDRAIVIGTQRG